MGKTKEKKAVAVPHQHIHTRLAFLRQAAQHLHEAQHLVGDDKNVQPAGSDQSTKESGGQVRHLVNNIRGVSRRSVLRLTQETKHSLCRHCDSLLIPGQTARVFIENSSKGRRKSWADVQVIECLDCRCVKRFPIGIDKNRKNVKPTIASGHQSKNQNNQ